MEIIPKFTLQPQNTKTDQKSVLGHQKKDAAMKTKFLVFRLEGNAEHSKIGKDRRRFVRRAFSR